MHRPQVINGVAIPLEASIEELLGDIEARSARRWAAFYALGYKSEPQALQHLIDYTGSSDPYNRRAAVEAMQYCKDITPALPFLRKCLQDPYDYVVSAACGTLAVHEDRESHNAIASLLKQSNPSLRTASLYALQTLWTEKDFPVILNLFKNDRCPKIRKHAAWLLIHRANQGNWSILFREFRFYPYHHCRVWACRFVEKFGDKHCQNDLLPLLKDQDGHVRKAAGKALSAISLKQ